MIPIGDSSRRHSTPWVTYLFIAINLAAFVWMLGLPSNLSPSRVTRVRELREQTNGVCYGFLAAPTEQDRFVCTYAFQPAEFFDTLSGDAPPGSQSAASVVASIVTALFLHAGWLHIAGNMLFLWVFGDNVEDRLGHLPFAAFYLLGGVAASLVQGMVDPDVVVPTVGASGAVAAVLGAYLVWFPKATVTVVIPFFVLIFIPLPVPAVLMIGLWFVQNLLAGLATISNAAGAETSVAWFAHVGGFCFGLVLALLVGGGRLRSRGLLRG